MNTIIWILQGLIAFIFIYSGICKASLSEYQLIQKGQTGVEGLSPRFIKFIGVCEIIGALGLFLPMLLGIQLYLTSLSAICLGLIMIPAAVIHFRRFEYKNVALNVMVLVICGVIAAWRI